MLHWIFHIWVQVAAVGKKVSPFTDGCQCEGGDLCLATRVSILNTSSPMSHCPSTLQQIPRAWRFTHQMTSPHYCHGATTVVAECSSHVSRHLLRFHRKRKQHRESEQGSIQHTWARINTDPPFLINFNNFPLLSTSKSTTRSLSTFLHSGLSSIFPLDFFIFFLGEGMRWQVPHPRSSEFFQSASEGISPSSPLFFLCILRFAILLSTAAPTRLGKFHTAAAERGGEGERERCRWDGGEKGWECWESHQWLYWGHLAGGSGRIWYLHANETQFSYYKITGLNYSPEDMYVCDEREVYLSAREWKRNDSV